MGNYFSKFLESSKEKSIVMSDLSRDLGLIEPDDDSKKREKSNKRTKKSKNRQKT